MSDPEIERLLLSPEEIRDRVAILAGEIRAAFGEREILAVGVLTGAFVFLADLVRRIGHPVQIAFLKASSYRDETRPGALALDLVGETDFRGRDLLVVEDIVDTGRSLAGILERLEALEPASIRTVALLDKRARREVDVTVDFTGFEVPDEFLVGYGLDYAERFRDLPGVGILSRSVYGADG